MRGVESVALALRSSEADSIAVPTTLEVRLDGATDSLLTPEASETVWTREEAESMNEATTDEASSESPVSLLKKCNAHACKFLSFLFENFPDFASVAKETFSAAWEVIVSPRVLKLVESSGGSVSSGFKLLKWWARIPR